MKDYKRPFHALRKPCLTKWTFQLLLTLVIFLTASCEKPVIVEESTNKKENNKGTDNKGNKNDNENKNDNGGWTNDDKTDDDSHEEWSNGEEWQDGDTVNVAAFKAHDFEDAVWVKGYIVGCASTTGGYKYYFTQPFESMTSILIADSKKENNKKNVVAIQLKSGSYIREDLNLAENPENHKRMVAIYGYKTTYLKIEGMKDILDYELK